MYCHVWHIRTPSARASSAQAELMGPPDLGLAFPKTHKLTKSFLFYKILCFRYFIRLMDSHKGKNLYMKICIILINQSCLPLFSVSNHTMSKIRYKLHHKKRVLFLAHSSCQGQGAVPGDALPGAEHHMVREHTRGFAL